HKGGALGVVARMGAHRVHVAPSPLDRIVEKDAAAAARLEEPVDGFDAPVDRFAGVPFAAGTRRQRYLLVGAGEAHHLGKITEHSPFAEIAAAGERPSPTEMKSAIHPLYRPGRRQ